MATNVTNTASTSNIGQLAWVQQGSRPATDGQVEGIQDEEVVGAVRAIAAHPDDPEIVYIGSVNGGIWRTENATSNSPTWEHLTGQLQSSSIGALSFDPTDTTHQTLIAATGRFSSNSRSGSGLLGVLRSTDGGMTWNVHDHHGAFRRVHITSVVARGNVIVAGANTSDHFRSDDQGSTWDRISQSPGSGLPSGIAFDVAGHPSDADRLFTHVGNRGIFRSDDVGATWQKVSDAAIDNLMRLGVSNVRIAVGKSNNVFVAIAASGPSRLAGVFRSGDGGSTWAALDIPQTHERFGATFGIHPGGQAGIHMSLAADPDDDAIVYIGGDRQPAFDEGDNFQPRNQFPNSVGAMDYSGRLFRIISSEAPGSQATHITHSNTQTNSAPHADSRDLKFAANGVLLEADDGGIYRRTDPQSDNGDWQSMNGDLQITEFHSVAWDSNVGAVIGGAQDTGTQQQDVVAATRWPSVSTGDGGAVAVDSTTTAGRSVRYSSYQFLSGFRREVYDSNGNLLSRRRVPLTVLGGGPNARVEPQFYTPIVLNFATPTRIILGARNGVYESFDEGDTVRRIAAGITANSGGVIAYGSSGNADMLYVGAGQRVFARTAAPPSAVSLVAAYPGNLPINGIALNPDDEQAAFVIDVSTVRYTNDAGATWTDITRNIMTAGASVLRSVVYCPALGTGSLIVGSNTGVYAADGPTFGTWKRLGKDFPNVPVLSLNYSPASDLVLAGTLGRGAWTLDVAAPVAV